LVGKVVLIGKVYSDEIWYLFEVEVSDADAV